MTNKYGNIKTTIDGITFDSKAEARRYQELKLLEKAGEINTLKLQPIFPLVVNNQSVGTYIADFSYTNRDGSLVVEDVKGVRTAVFNLKARLMKAIHNIEVKIP